MKAKWSVVMVFCILMFAVGLPSASAAPRAAAAIDGDGLMAVSPTHVTYGAASTTFTFTFTANNDFGSGSQVSLSIPTGWAAPSGSNITVSNGTCTFNGSPGWQIDPPTRSVLVDLTSCLTNHSFTITYQAIPPGVAGSPYTFRTSDGHRSRRWRFARHHRGRRRRSLLILKR